MAHPHRFGLLPKETASTPPKRKAAFETLGTRSLLNFASRADSGGIGQARLPLNPGTLHGLEGPRPLRRLAQLSGSSFTMDAS